MVGKLPKLNSEKTNQTVGKFAKLNSQETNQMVEGIRGLYPKSS